MDVWYPKWYWQRWHCTYYLVTFALCQRRKATTLLHATASTVTSTCGKKGQETPDLIISKRSALFLSSNYSTSKSTLYQLYSLVSFGWLLAQHFVIPWFFKCQIRIRCGNVMLVLCSIRNKTQGNNCWVDCNSFASSSLPQRCSTHLALTIDWYWLINVDGRAAKKQHTLRKLQIRPHQRCRRVFNLCRVTS